ncbi:MAG: DUF1553 domain-containing protein [Bryobacterales bacterium]|nr:DUF1553 domain-containing protein [Bryobacterales bacterium]
MTASKLRVITLWAVVAGSAAIGGGVFLLRAQQEETQPEHLDPNCSLFNRPRPRFARPGQPSPNQIAAAHLTTKIATMLPAVSSTERAQTTNFGTMPTIDRHLFQAMSEAGVTPTLLTNDYEFIRRITLDLTGRVPTPERVTSFVADTASDKRVKLAGELLARPEWTDKWTMYFGDLYKNCIANSQVRRFPDGVKAFNDWIRASLTAGKPYNQMVTELLTTSGDNSYNVGEVNWLVGGVVTGGPVQDVFDQQIANVAETFLGVGHLNCLLCHNGRRHLDELSLWGKSATRTQAWQMSAFLARTEMRRTNFRNENGNLDYYWGIFDNARFRTDYQLNTTTGNRPARQPIGATASITPVYIFNEKTPARGENYRVALAREVTSDFQFARATVNYLWKEFFGVGIVDPPDQFDPARLDPDSPPPAPWTLQPSNPRLLNALAQDFINSGYDVKALMKQIVTSQAYQLSSRHDAASWNPEWDKYFARKFVRRLWAEEIHDAIAQTSGLLPSYNLGVNGTAQFAMKFPETTNQPGQRVPITSFLNAFLRGNRDDEERRSDGSISQALNLMNDDFVVSRIRVTAANGLLARNISKSDDDLITTLFLTVLSRNPTAAERSLAQAGLRSGNRNQEAEHLLWSLYNKVDFIFNY